MHEPKGDVPESIDAIVPYQPILLSPDSKLGYVEVEPDGTLIELRPLGLKTTDVFEAKEIGPDLLMDPSLIENVFSN